MVITKKNFLLLIICLIVLSFLKLLNLLPGIFGGFLLVSNTIIFFYCLDPLLKLLKIPSDNFIKFLILFAYYSISLTILYYLFGLTNPILIIWLFLNFFVVFFLFYSQRIKTIKIIFPPIKNFLNGLKKIEFWLIFIIFILLTIFFFSQPIVGGDPTPWPKIFIVGFALFFIATFFLLKNSLAEQDNPFLSFLYLFLIISVIATRYVLSYGYDTLIHQGALKHIAAYGQIIPLTPFYIGQYAMEILINKFSGLSFTFIERWFGPVLFLILIFFGGRYFLKRLKLSNNSLLIPISVVLLFPEIFSYTSPFANSLLWGLLAILFIILFFKQKKVSDIKLAVICSLASFFIHPFVGFNILVWATGFYFFKKSFQTIINKWLLSIIFIISTVAVILAFIVFNWLKDTGLNIYNPLYFLGTFASIFGDPAWYLRDDYPWWLGIIYLYEKINFFLLFFLILYWPIKNLKRSKEIVVLVSMSALISAWLFVSSFKIDNYFFGDQINYGYRLIQVAKWFLWPIFLIALAIFFTFLKKQKVAYRYIIIGIFSLIITLSWYLAYPRQDDISHMNVNSIRNVDYKAIDLIYKNEFGKNGYIVLTNQIIGAGAILNYGFGPYYKIGKEDIFYYSLPWGGELSKLYNKIMDAKIDNFSKYLAETKKIIKPLGINKYYFVYTDAWSPSPEIIEQLNYFSINRWNIDNKIFIYLFKI